METKKSEKGNTESKKYRSDKAEIHRKKREMRTSEMVGIVMIILLVGASIIAAIFYL